MSQPSDREARLAEVRLQIRWGADQARELNGHDVSNARVRWLLAEVERLERALREIQKVGTGMHGDYVGHNCDRCEEKDQIAMDAIGLSLPDILEEEQAALEGRDA